MEGRWMCEHVPSEYRNPPECPGMRLCKETPNTDLRDHLIVDRALLFNIIDEANS